MGDKTKIEWSDATWNPVTGCSKVSRGCTHCYAERVFPRAYGRDRKFTDVLTHPKRLDQPLHWKKPRRIFVNSMSDLFHEAIPDDFIISVFDVMRRCHQHTFQVLTKRPARMRDFCQRLRFRGDGVGKMWLAVTASDPLGYRIMGGGGCTGMTWVQLGVSCEDQETADERIPLLLQTPAAVRFVSLEPLLGPIDLTRIPVPREFIDESFGERGGEFLFNALTDKDDDHFFNVHKKLDWVICGGESGPHARPCHPDWIRSLRDQCVAAGVPFFFKQWGEWTLKSHKPREIKITQDTQFGVLSADGSWIAGATGWNGRDIDPDTSEAYMVRVGKKKSGAVLDGREWREFPPAYTTI